MTAMQPEIRIIQEDVIDTIVAVSMSNPEEEEEEEEGPTFK